MIRTLCRTAERAAKLARGERWGRLIIVNGADYLSRTFLSPKSPAGRLFLHRFLASDPKGELHSHPWDKSIGLVLTGGYREFRRGALRGDVGDGAGGGVADYEITVRDHLPWRPWAPWRGINVITQYDFHRVELLDGEACTLFLRFRRIGGWKFWNPETDTYRDMTSDPSTED